MSLVAAGFSKILRVDFLNHGIFVRLTDALGSVIIVKCSGTDCLEVLKTAYRSRLMRLTAAVYTTAGATHNLNKVELFAVFHTGKECVCS